MYRTRCQVLGTQDEGGQVLTLTPPQGGRLTCHSNNTIKRHYGIKGFQSGGMRAVIPRRSWDGSKEEVNYKQRQGY